jgi:alkylation response protein AidB-like acyl-CoA dehydrogenase
VSLTREQQDLRDAVRGVLASAGSADDGGRAAWRRLCGEVGAAGLAIPERYGGAGAGPAETGVVMEELGRELTSSPCSARPSWPRRRCWAPATTTPAAGCCPRSPTGRRRPRWRGL